MTDAGIYTTEAEAGTLNRTCGLHLGSASGPSTSWASSEGCLSRALTMFFGV